MAAAFIEKKVIAILAMPNTMLLDVAGPTDVFARASQVLKTLFHSPAEAYDIVILSPDPSRQTITYASGVTIEAPENYTSYKGPIDTLLVAGFSSPEKFLLRSEFLEWLRNQSGHVRRLGSICRGTFVLAEAGLLKGRRATTHWKYAADLQRDYPDIKVDPDPIFIHDHHIYTSAGVSSGIDLALALVEEDYGREVAAEVARQLVLYLRRPGNQSQFSTLLAQQESEHEPIRELQAWLMEHLHEELHIEQLAEFCSMSPRNFARVFLRETGMTPGKYLEKLRVETARRRLEETRLSLEQIAADCGLGSADTMRRLFLRHLKITPSHYRKSFRSALETELSE